MSYIDLIPICLLTNRELHTYKQCIFSGTRVDNTGIFHTLTNHSSPRLLIDSLEVFYDYCILQFAPEFYDNSLYSCDYLQKGSFSGILTPKFDDFDKIKEGYKSGILGYKSNYECPYCNHKSKYGNGIIAHFGPRWKCSSFNPRNENNVIYNDVIMVQIKEEFYDLLWKHKLNELYIYRIQKQILEVEIEVYEIQYKMFNNILELYAKNEMNSNLICNESNNRNNDVTILQEQIKEFSIDNSNNMIILNNKNNKLLNELYIDKIQKQILETEVEVTNRQHKTFEKFLGLEKTVMEIQNTNTEEKIKDYTTEVLQKQLKKFSIDSGNIINDLTNDVRTLQTQKCSINNSNYFENKTQFIMNIIILFYILLTLLYNNLPTKKSQFLPIDYM